MYRIYKMLVAVLVCLFLLGCDQKESPTIDLESQYSQPSAYHAVIETEKSIVLALGGMTLPKQGYAYYKDLISYLEKHLGQSISIMDKSSYAEINNALKDGKVDIAFVCGGPYVDGHDNFDLELLVAPQVKGILKYHSYVIVNRDSKINKLEELKGKKFAFTDPMSNAGRIVPTYTFLKELGVTPETFFSNYIYSGSHDNSITMVAAGIVDGAGVDSLIWDYLNDFDPKDTSKTKIISISPPFGIPPVVVSHQLDSKTKNKLKQLFLDIHTDNEGRGILYKMRIEKFVTVDDSNYNDIREAKKWLKEHNIIW